MGNGLGKPALLGRRCGAHDRGLSRAQVTMFCESLMTLPSSRTSTGTKLSPVSRLTCFRPFVMSGHDAKP